MRSPRTGKDSGSPPCYFDAIALGDDHKAHVDPDKCVGCGGCYHVCPVDAIEAPVVR